jgi:hypothetical protein
MKGLPNEALACLNIITKHKRKGIDSLKNKKEEGTWACLDNNDLDLNL